MKFFALIFSLYLMGLSFIPCGDRKECKEKSATAISASSQHEKHSNDTENCPPMCHCACCSISISCQSTTDFTVPQQFFPSVKHTSYEVSYASQASFSIWQPPKSV